MIRQEEFDYGLFTKVPRTIVAHDASPRLSPLTKQVF